MAYLKSAFRARVWREGTIIALVPILFLSLSLSAVSQDDQKPADQPKAAAPAAGAPKKGDQIFHTRCMICHNKQPGDNSPFGPPNLFDAFKTKAITPSQAEEIITHGKGQMPAFGNILTKADMQSVIDYLKSSK